MINIERLSGDYNRGYTAAIQDIIEIFNYIQSDLKHHHKTLTAKNSIELLNTILNNRMYIRDQIGNGFIRWNCKLSKFEYYMPEKNNK